MRAFILLVVALACPASAAAQSAIFKCVDAKGQVAFQNKPCPTGSDVADIREYEPLSREEAWRAEQERRQRIATQAAANERARVQAASTRTYVYTDKRPTTVQVRRKQCAAAKQARDQARKNAPMWRDVHYLEPWEVKVREACKGLW